VEAIGGEFRDKGRCLAGKLRFVEGDESPSLAETQERKIWKYVSRVLEPVKSLLQKGGFDRMEPSYERNYELSKLQIEGLSKEDAKRIAELVLRSKSKREPSLEMAADCFLMDIKPKSKKPPSDLDYDAFRVLLRNSIEVCEKDGIDLNRFGNETFKVHLADIAERCCSHKNASEGNAPGVV